MSGSRSISDRVRLSWIALPLALFAFSGCAGAKYLLQAAHGQLALINHAKPIEEVIRDERTPPRIRALLAEIPGMKRFGERNGLKPTRNYTDYVKLDRPVAVWVVSACEKLQFKSKEWSFPIVGSFPYLGWFDRGNAEEFAEGLRAEGWDTNLRGASAYSTLGWFRDAVLSSMIAPGPEALGELANTILHESVHATVYVNGQSYFNESLASFVADRLTSDYLAEARGASSTELGSYRETEEEFGKIELRMHQAYEALEAIYSSSKSDSEKLEAKARVIAKLSEDIGAKREINNATLVQYKTYHTGTAEFDSLLKACGGNFIRFMSAVSRLKPDSFGAPQAEDLSHALAPLIRASCR